MISLIRALYYAYNMLNTICCRGHGLITTSKWPIRIHHITNSETAIQWYKLPTNCLTVFDHFVGLVLKGIISTVSNLLALN